MPDMETATKEYDKLLKRYAEYAPIYDQRWAKYTQATLAKAVSRIDFTDEGSLLDVACGTGILIAQIRDMYPHTRVTGIDVSSDMLEQARLRPLSGSTENVEWRVGHAERLPVGSEEFDMVTCTNAFHLVEKPTDALIEFQRVLKSGGKLLIVDWCRDYTTIRLLGILLRVLGRHQRQIRTLKQFVSLAESQGFQIEHKERFRATWFWGMMCIVARKT